ncbi:GIY-YIG nuclease family protein [Elusimicrobiota bacterium]
MTEKQYCTYILTNSGNNVFYAGVTSNLQKKIWEHKSKIVKGFTDKYNVSKLVYYEIFDNPLPAIEMEKRIKAGSRKKKIKLIESRNPSWQDLWGSIQD